MANTAKLIEKPGSPAARKSLTAGPKLYVVREVTDRLHLCYRRRVAKKDELVNGSWVIRRFDPDSGKAFPYTTKIIGIADDEIEADGSHCLTFRQAVKKAEDMTDAPTRAQVEADTATVREVLLEYVAAHDATHFQRKGRVVRSDASQRVHLHLLGQEAVGKQKASPPAAIASMRISSLSDADLRRWRASLPKHLTQSTINRLCSDLKSALNEWYNDNVQHADPRFREMLRLGLKRPKGQTDAERDPAVRKDQILPKETVAAIVQAAREVDREDDWGGDLHRMILLLAATGSRFSQIARLRVGDFQPHAEKGARLMVPVSRKGKGEKDKSHTSVPIGPEVVAALLPVYTGRDADELLLQHHRKVQIGPAKWERKGRKGWEASSEIARPWQEIRKRAGVPSAIPYALRHSSIVRQLKALLPIQLVASVHDTSVAVIEKHYASHVTDALDGLLRDAMVSLEISSDENVVPFRGQA